MHKSAFRGKACALTAMESNVDALQELKEVGKSLRNQARKFVTGSEETPLRLHLAEELKKPVRVKLMDKLSFTLGIVNILATEYFLLSASWPPRQRQLPACRLPPPPRASCCPPIPPQLSPHTFGSGTFSGSSPSWAFGECRAPNGEN